jgi:hypothetical protein
MALWLWTPNLSNRKWIRVYEDFRLDGFHLKIEHRHIWITEFISRQDERSHDKVIELIVNMQKAVNYYLDAIWC